MPCPSLPATKRAGRGAPIEVPNDTRIHPPRAAEAHRARLCGAPPTRATPFSGAKWLCLVGWGAFPLGLIKRNELPSPSCTQIFTPSHFRSRLNSGKAGWAETTWTRCTLDPSRRGSRCRTGSDVCGLSSGTGTQSGGRAGAGGRRQGRNSRASPAGTCVERAQGSSLTSGRAFPGPGHCNRDPHPPTVRRGAQPGHRTGDTKGRETPSGPESQFCCGFNPLILGST